MRSIQIKIIIANISTEWELAAKSPSIPTSSKSTAWTMLDITMSLSSTEFKEKFILTINNLTAYKEIGKREDSKLEKESSTVSNASTTKEISSKE